MIALDFLRSGGADFEVGEARCHAGSSLLPQVRARFFRFGANFQGVTQGSPGWTYYTGVFHVGFCIQGEGPNGSQPRYLTFKVQMYVHNNTRLLVHVLIHTYTNVRIHSYLNEGLTAPCTTLEISVAGIERRGRGRGKEFGMRKKRGVRAEGLLRKLSHLEE